MTLARDTFEGSGATFHVATNTDHDGGKESKSVVRKNASASRDVYAFDARTSCQSSPMRCTCAGTSPPSSGSFADVNRRMASDCLNWDSGRKCSWSAVHISFAVVACWNIQTHLSRMFIRNCSRAQASRISQRSNALGSSGVGATSVPLTRCHSPRDFSITSILNDQIE